MEAFLTYLSPTATADDDPLMMTVVVVMVAVMAFVLSSFHRPAGSRGPPPRRRARLNTHAKMTLRARSESLPLLSELRSESLKDRHWRPLLRRLGIRVAYSELNLGLLWGCALTAHKKDIAETVLSAQGEMALEEFLRQARRGKERRKGRPTRSKRLRLCLFLSRLV